MTPEEINTARKSLNLNLEQMALMLGYTGKNRRAMMHDIESGRKEFRPAQMRLMDAYLSGYRPKDWPELKQA